MSVLRLPAVVLAVVPGLVLSPATEASADHASIGGVPLDVEIAIDGTGSMGTTIERAKLQSRAIVDGVRAVLPNSRFAVVVFRDFGSSGPEYELLQPLTSDTALLHVAFSRVVTRTNPSAGNGPAESYNLAFHMSYSDDRLGWRANAEKLVVVVGDAEPQSAGSVGLPGCRDTAADQHGLNSLTELANMRAAGLTLLMLRVSSPDVTLSCYKSIAASAAPGGGAVDIGRDLVSPIVALAHRSFGVITVRCDRARARTGAAVRFTVSLSNPTSGAIRLEELRLRLPFGFVYRKGSTTGAITRDPTANGNILVWKLRRTMNPSDRIRVRVTARVAATRSGRYRAGAGALVRPAYGDRIATTAIPTGITLDAPRPTKRTKSAGR
jgi:hypothetical protein